MSNGVEVKDVLQSLFESNLAESCPILVVVTHRDRSLMEHTSPSWAPQWLQQSRRYSQINLGPLSRSEREELTKELLCLEGKLAVRVEQLCGGNPMFAIELVGDWVSRGVLEMGEQGFRLKPGIELSLPDSLHAVWHERVAAIYEDLPQEAALFLERAAVLGERVWDTDWALVCKGFSSVSEEEQGPASPYFWCVSAHELLMSGEWPCGRHRVGDLRIRCCVKACCVFQRKQVATQHHQVCVEFLQHYGIPSSAGSRPFRPSFTGRGSNGSGVGSHVGCCPIWTWRTTAKAWIFGAL